jgi:hypothetical protein
VELQGQRNPPFDEACESMADKCMLVAHEDEIQDLQFEVGKLHVMLAECNSK